ncbi:MAG: hypothetical protein ACXVCX_10250 [Ktedonobacterales bacterium]
MPGPYEPYDRDRGQQSGWSERSDARNSRPQRAGGNSRPDGERGSGQYGGYGQANPPSRGRSGYGGGEERLDDGYGRAGPTSRGRPSGSSGGYDIGHGSGYGGGSSGEGGHGRPSPSSRGRRGENSRPADAYGAGGYGGGGYESYGQGQGSYAQDGYGSSGGYGGYGNYGGYEDRGGYGEYAGGYGQQGSPSQQQGWGSTSRTLYGEPQYDEFEAPTRKKSRRGLWITLGVVAAVLLVTCAGVGYGVTQYTAPATAAGLFCGNLKVQNYVTSYALLDSTSRAHESQTQFAEANADLDRAEGVVTNCKAATGSNAYVYSLGGSSAIAVLVAQRATGGSFQGAVHLRNEGGSWKVAALDPALLGVDLQALVSMDAYCAAQQSQSYDAAYAMLGKGQQAKQKRADYTQDAQWRDQIDGTISACQVTGIGTGNDASKANLTVSVTRGKSAAHKGAVALSVEDAAWKLAAAGPETQGSDLGPARTGARFSDDLANANNTDLTSLLSSGFLGGASVDMVASVFSGSYDGIKWNGCTLDLSAYKVSGTSASFNVSVKLTELSSGRNADGTLLLTFIKEGSSWKLDDFKAQ